MNFKHGMSNTKAFRAWLGMIDPGRTVAGKGNRQPSTYWLMRITIKTSKPIKDLDVKALYLIAKAMELAPKMARANLQFFADKLGLKVVPK